jgi:uncharacterized membrane protein YhiD involved in acid resistance
MLDTRQTPVSDAPLRLIIVAVAAVGFVGAGLLWARFGEAVYVNGIMTAILSCF